MPCDAVCRRHRGGRRAVTPNGDTWSGSPNPTSGAGLHHTCGVLGDGETWPTAVAVDRAGKPWIHEGILDRVRRVDPEAGPTTREGCRLGKYDLTVPLPSKHVVGSIVGWMTTEQPLPGRANSGTWTVVQDGSTPGRLWGRVSWDGEEPGSAPPGSSLGVEARAADAVADLDTQQYAPVANRAPFRLAGRFIEVRASFRRSAGGDTPVLSDIRIEAAANAPPVAVDNVLPTTRGTRGTVSVLWNDSDPDGDRLSVKHSTDGAHGTVHCTPAGACAYTPAPGYAGRDSFTYEVSDGRGGADTARVAVTVMNSAPTGVGSP
jgi:hypothetical protein